MGLRLVSHYYERNEALIVSAALDAAGIPNFIHGHAHNSVQPFEQVALGGFRVMVCEQDLHNAVAVIREARRTRSFEGERLSQRTFLALSILLSFAFWMFLPFRTSTWHDVDG